LQRFIREQIYRADREYRREQVALNGRGKVVGPDFDAYDESIKRFVAYWWDVRHWIEENEDFNPGPYRLSEALERSAKRALYTLVKRGEIVRIKGGDGDLNKYITKEMDERLRQITQQVMKKLNKKRLT
jgi:uncharacterized protein YaaR (DUF327 family)